MERTLTTKELHQTQRICLEMLIELDRICRKYDIEYSIDGGTLLGAVRHGGFIPWDDDVDVIMLHDEYRRFRKACRQELDNKRFFLQDETTDPAYRFGYAKMRRKGTIQLKRGHEHLKDYPGVILDIMYIDNVPDGFITRRIHYFACFSIRKIQYALIGSRCEESAIMRAWYRLLLLIPKKAVYRWLYRLSAYWNGRETKLLNQYTYPNYENYKYGMPAAFFKEYTDIEFEGRKLRAVKDYNAYLTGLYGDYMKLPPKEQRVSHVHYVDIKLIDVDLQIKGANHERG